jgi:hypothetical protein
LRPTTELLRYGNWNGVLRFRVISMRKSFFQSVLP